MIRLPPRSTLFPYPTLFLSVLAFAGGAASAGVAVAVAVGALVASVVARQPLPAVRAFAGGSVVDRKSTRLNSSHANISYAVFCLKKKTRQADTETQTSAR